MLKQSGSLSPVRSGSLSNRPEFRSFLGFVLLCTFLLALPACQGESPSPIQPTTTESRPAIKTNTPAPTITALPEPTPTRVIQLEPSDLESINIIFWHVWDGAKGDLLQELAEEFNHANSFGITVSIIVHRELFQDLRDAIGTNTMPDLVVGNIQQALMLDRNGTTVTNLSGYINDPVFGISGEDEDEIISVLWLHEIADEKLFGIPMYRTSQVIYYNITWAEELGFSSPPTTPEEFREQSCAAAQSKLTDEETQNDGKGGWMIDTDPSNILSWIFAFGGNVVGPDQDYNLKSPEVSNAFRFLKDLEQEGCAWSPENESPHTEFANREGLFFGSSILSNATQKSAFQAVNNPDEWSVIPFPSTQETPAVVVSGPDYIILNTTPERQLASWLFVKWLSTPQVQARWISQSGYLPTLSSTTHYLENYISENPEWAAFLTFLPHGTPEPQLGSWLTVRWILSDAANQLFQAGFPSEEIPTLLEELDSTAREIHGLTQ